MIRDYYTRLLQIGASGCPTTDDRPTDRPVAPLGSAIRIVYRHAPPYTLRGVLRIESDGWMLRFVCVGVTHHIVLGSVAELVFEAQA
jgi:hypothetical protein